MTSAESESGGRLIWLIALERTLRGLLLLAAGIYLLVKSGANFGDIANHIAARLELDPQRPWIRHIVAKLGHLKKHEVQLFGVLAIGYAALEITEGAGLFYRTRWAEWLPVVFADFGIVMWALVRSLVQRRVVRGAFITRNFDAGAKTTPRGKAHRAWTVLLAGFSPNAYVIDIDPDRDTVLLHDLVTWRRSEEPA